MATAQPPATNQLLGMLAMEDLAELSPLLRRVSLQRGLVLMDPGRPVEAVYFPAGSVISLLQVMQDGTMVEAATIGAEGAAGLDGLVDSEHAVGRGLVQVAGVAWRVEIQALTRLVAERPGVGMLMQRYQRALMMEILLSVGCGHLHSARQRVARWLLTMFDRARADELQLTHEFLSEVLAIRRPTVSAIAGEMQQAGVLSYRRGRVLLLDRQRLIRMSCECYGSSRMDRQRMAHGTGAEPKAGTMRRSI